MGRRSRVTGKKKIFGGVFMFEPLDKIFDFNHDGKLNGFERATEYEFMSNQGFFVNTKSNNSEELFSEEEQDLFADEMDELEIAGLDTMELSMMDEVERREAIEDADLDPDDYDFD